MVPGASPPRRTPTQERGERRLAAVLDAAAEVFSDVGYEAATMCEIAARAGSCIGSLYQFFPNKESLAQALRADYGSRIQESWKPLQREAASLTVDELAARLIGGMVEFIAENPAFLPLLDAPASTRSTSIRAISREMMAAILAVKLKTPWPRLMRISAVTLQILRSMIELYADAPTAERKKITREFETALGCYLAAQPTISKTMKGSKT